MPTCADVELRGAERAQDVFEFRLGLASPVATFTAIGKNDSMNAVVIAGGWPMPIQRPRNRHERPPSGSN